MVGHPIYHDRAVALDMTGEEHPRRSLGQLEQGGLDAAILDREHDASPEPVHEVDHVGGNVATWRVQEIEGLERDRLGHVDRVRSHGNVLTPVAADPFDGRMTSDAYELLRQVHGGRVLDVAAGYGGSAAVLADGLADYTEIVGIEVDPSRRARFEDATAGRHDVRFEQGDFLRSTYAPGSFDTVAVSASLHHFVDAAIVLQRMLEIVAPGGTVIVSEMYRDGQTAAQETEVAVHDWMAEVDTSTGGVHRPTFRRSEIVALVAALNLEDVRTADRADLLIDPHDAGAVAEVSDLIDRYAVKAAGIAELESRVAGLRGRLAEVGVQEATVLTLVGRRPTG